MSATGRAYITHKHQKSQYHPQLRDHSTAATSIIAEHYSQSNHLSGRGVSFSRAYRFGELTTFISLFSSINLFSNMTEITKNRKIAKMLHHCPDNILRRPTASVHCRLYVCCLSY